jgi:Transferase family
VVDTAMEDETREEAGLTKQAMPQPRVIGRVLRFSSDDLQKIKQQATNTNGVEWISTFEALSAYLMQIIYRARLYVLKAQGLSIKDSAAQIYRGFWSPIDVRGPSRLNLPSRYFGNAVFCPYTQLPHDLLADRPLWEVAKAIHTVMRALSGKHIEQSIKWYFAQPDKSRVRVDYSFAQGSFLVTQTTKFNIYDGVDFEKDKSGNAIPPMLVTSPYNQFNLIDGVAKIRSTEEQLLKTPAEGHSTTGQRYSVDVYLSLIEPLWGVLDKDPEFPELYL